VARTVRAVLAVLALAVAVGFAAGSWAFAPAAVAFIALSVFTAAECGIAAAAAADALRRTPHVALTSPEDVR
jgi:Na+-translocating ferredoxin:NAD+ oxidoreductase RnfD subunit